MDISLIVFIQRIPENKRQVLEARYKKLVVKGTGNVSVGPKTNVGSWSYFSSVKSAASRSTSNLYAGSRDVWCWVVRYSGACTLSMRSNPNRLFLFSLASTDVWCQLGTDGGVFFRL